MTTSQYIYKRNGAGDVFRKPTNKRTRGHESFFRGKWQHSPRWMKDVWNLPNMIVISEDEANQMIS
jgi:hypothetical protein